VTLKPAHICGFCQHYCKTGQSERQRASGQGVVGSCGNGVEPAQRLHAGYPVSLCYAFQDMRRESVVEKR
jgi:hypothetical protein